MALANALTDWSRQCGRSARPQLARGDVPMVCRLRLGEGRRCFEKISANIKGADDRINGYLWLK